MAGDEEKMQDTVEIGETHQRYERTGMSLGLNSDIGVCVTMICLTILSLFVTAIKIVVIDMNSYKYASLFGYNVTTTEQSTKN